MKKKKKGKIDHERSHHLELLYINKKKIIHL